ncbi:MAG TPA: YbaB/EbfC family nucleoid-associated protein [Acidimicrobiales bacterium]|nr:YbaB/EbfC family nucleoid-associated protein [Acidimicrobiales bacterium]
MSDSQDGGSAPDLGALFSQLGQMRESIHAAQESATSQVVEGSAGGGVVRVVGTGGLDVQAVLIDPSVVDPGDVEMLQDLVLAAVRDLIDKAQALQSQALGGLDLGGGIEGLLGG